MTGGADVCNAAKQLSRRAACVVLVTVGERGVLQRQRGIQRQYPAHAVKALDATAAGDTFFVVLANALADGAPGTPPCGMRRRRQHSE